MWWPDSVQNYINEKMLDIIVIHLFQNGRMRYNLMVERKYLKLSF